MSLTQLTIHETKAAIAKGETTYYDVAKAYADRINDVEEKVDALLLQNTEKALAEAKLYDEGSKSPEGALGGIPYILKDNICTKGLRTTCASKILGNFVPPYNADVYDRLNNAGCVLLGKANMDEFAMGSSTENSAYKVTKNPWDLSKIPGGSSGGSAAAVAADMCAFSLGSDTGGSIRQPASVCGVVGMKPSYGLVSRYGLVAFASSLDQIGPFTKDVEDCALVLNSICGYDAKDSTSIKRDKEDYTLKLKDGVKGLRIGISNAFKGEGVQPEVLNATEESIRALKEMGAEIVEVDFKLLDYALPVYYVLASAEASSNLARYDGVRYGVRAKDYEGLVDMYVKTRTEGFGKEVKRRIMLGTYALSSGYYDAYYRKAMQVRTLIMEEYAAIFNQCDVMLTPTAASTAFGIGEKTANPLDMYMSDLFTVPVNIAGLPGISIPTACDNAGMPIGTQLVGPVLSESTLLQAAYALENAMNFRADHAPQLR